MPDIKSLARVLLLGVALPALNGCHMFHGNSCHGTQPYMNAKSDPSLKVPPGLEAPDTTQSLRLPHLNEPAPPPRKGKDPCLDEPPSFKVQQPKSAPQA